MNIFKAFYISLFAACFICSCDSSNVKAPVIQEGCDSVKNIQEGFVTGTSSACSRFEDFFEDEASGKKFFPVGKWLFDFDYAPNKQELYLTHLNTNVNDMYVNSIFIVEDTIKINETKKGENYIHTEENTNIEYKLENVQLKTYIICINNDKNSCVKLNLTVLDSLNNEFSQGLGHKHDVSSGNLEPKCYSLFDDGSVLIASKDTSFCEGD